MGTGRFLGVGLRGKGYRERETDLSAHDVEASDDL